MTQEQIATPDLPPRPHTGHDAIDAALAAVTWSEDVREHHGEIAQALNALQAALNPDLAPRLT